MAAGRQGRGKRGRVIPRCWVVREPVGEGDGFYYMRHRTAGCTEWVRDPRKAYEFSSLAAARAVAAGSSWDVKVYRRGRREEG